MLCCFHAFAQEAEVADIVNDSADSGRQWLIVPRVEVNPYIRLKNDGYKGFDFGWTSLYGLFDGSFGNSDFSYSAEVHLFSSDPASLYRNTLRSDEVNWLDWANITYSPGNFYFTAGKQVMSVGSLEVDEYDFNSYDNLCSTVWCNLQLYLWGATAGWVSDDEGTDLSLQVVTSPYGQKHFASGLYSYSALWRGEYGPWKPLWSVGAMAYDKGSYVGHVAVSNRFTAGDFTLGLDYSIRGYDFRFTESSFLAFIGWDPSDRFSIKAKYGLEGMKNPSQNEDVFGWDPSALGEDPFDYYVPASLLISNHIGGLPEVRTSYQFGGAVAEFRPIENLRLHTAVAYNTWARSISLNAGATYFLSLRKK